MDNKEVLICVGCTVDLVPIFALRDSPEGIAALARQREAAERRDREEWERLREKYGG